MNFFELLKSANHNLFRNKVRTFLTIIAIFVGSFTIILNVAINSGVNSFIDEQTDALGGDNFIMLMSDEATSAMGGTGMGTNGGPTEYIDSKTVAAETSLSEEDLEKLKKIDGINGDSFYSPTPMGGEGYFASSKTDKKYAIQGLIILPPGNFKIPLATGRLPDDSKNTYQVTLEPEYAKALGYDSDEDIIGQTITVGIKNDVLDTWTDIPVEVVGVEANGIVSSSLGAIMSRALYNKIFDVAYQHLPSSYKDNLPTYYVMATFDNERFTEDEIKQSVADAGYFAWTVTDMMGTIRSFFDVIMVVFNVFGGIALLAAAIGIVNTLLMSVEERTREIGLDKALGMSSWKIFLSFAIEAILIGFWGSALGVCVAMAIGTVVNAAVHAPGGFLEIFPTFDLFRFTPGTVIPLVLIVMFIALLAGTAPAIKAARKNPIEALRYE